MHRCGYCAKSQHAILDVPRMARWQICQRLQQLSLQAICQSDGSLMVEVEHGVAIAQIHSVVRQVLQGRSSLVDWLEDCWSQPVAPRV